MSNPSTWYEILGAACFGGVIGWTAHNVLHRVSKVSIGSIASFTAAVGGGGVLRAFGSEFPFLAIYSIGLAVAYFSRAFLTQGPILASIIGSATGTNKDGSGLNEEGWDLLATLWKFQKQCVGSDAKTRWKMAISPLSADFADFATGFGRAKKVGYIDILPDGHFIQLSTGGYQFCQQNEKKLNKRKRLFFVEH